MVAITLPDGSKREFDGIVTGAELATDIGPGLAKAALAVRVNGELRDLAREITTDSAVEIITLKSDDETVYDLLRHDAAHVLAEAVQTLYPGTQITFGPSIEDGFYYDFHREKPFTPDEFEAIEKKMRDIVAEAKPIVRKVVDRADLKKAWQDAGESFKAEWIDELDTDAEITVYEQGDWYDMCAGPHLPTTKHLGTSFKLMKVAGSYWRGDAKNPPLQRIYGTAWRNDKELKAYLTRLEEAEKRDHRKLGREMELFHIQEEAVGSVFWHPKGWRLYRTVENYMRRQQETEQYMEIKTPQLVDRSLWEASGHWDKYHANMFTAVTEDDRVWALKPMNCPCHVQVFKQGLKSYRDLPMRLAEFGSCHRYEPSGALHGIMRVRGFVQDDAHIFCAEDQITSETKIFCDFLQRVYKDFGFDGLVVKFSDRPEVRAGSDETWDKSEGALKEAIEAAGIPWTLNPGEGAFYGPKLEFVLRDAIGRDWQCGTLQVDFVLPERLDATYIGEDGDKHRPVMLHRAILGSFERFLGILIENHAGKFPLWLAPTQIVVAPITSEVDDYAVEVAKKFEAAGMHVETDLRNEKINYKVREHSLKKVPLIFAVGKREAEEGSVSVRRLGEKHQKVMSLDEAFTTYTTEAKAPDLRR